MRLGFLYQSIWTIIFLFTLSDIQAAAMKRVVLGFWDSTEYEYKDSSANHIHQNLEVVLNHYGLKVEYIDVAKELPKELFQVEKLKKYRGVLSWFRDDQMNDPENYLKVLKNIRKANLPFLLMGEFGFLIDSSSKGKEKKEFEPSVVNKVLNDFDLDFKGDYFDNPMILEAKKLASPHWIEFERTLDNELKSVRVVNRMGPGETWLQIQTLGDKSQSDVIFVNPKISYVQSGYEIFTNPIDYKNQWRVNPFEIVKQTFFKNGLELAPDITTLYGSRVFYTHIDGDGYINVSQVDHKTYSGDIIIKEIIDHYKLPIMVSVIIAEVSSKYLGNASIEENVREMYKLPYVEGGSHTFTHPMSWDLNPTLADKKIYLKGEDIKNHKGPIVGYPLKDYVMNYETEVVGSLNYINENYMPKGKKAKTLLWSGSCSPPEKPLALLDKEGFLNMNGGDGKFDGVDASYTGLSPLYRMVGGYTQVYSSNANENLYTNLWEGPYSGFREVIEAFKNTEKPIRIRPINIYYHFYSGERVSSLKALKETYDFSLKQKINPIFPSLYIEMVHDWKTIEINKVNFEHYKVQTKGKVKTFRIDEPEKVPDYKKSVNIIGHQVINESLYVFLGKETNAEIYLTSKKQTQPYISEATVLVKDFNKKEITGVAHYPGYIEVMNKDKKKRFDILKTGEFRIQLESM
ncbi:MAG: hypothetical protein CME63_14115 [Halobacteriovoraceae bacterium]|nr:hypothetical protein [Halobacteriovoraceae bacterium]